MTLEKMNHGLMLAVLAALIYWVVESYVAAFFGG